MPEWPTCNRRLRHTTAPGCAADTTSVEPAARHPGTPEWPSQTEPVPDTRFRGRYIHTPRPDPFARIVRAALPHPEIACRTATSGLQRNPREPPEATTPS